MQRNYEWYKFLTQYSNYTALYQFILWNIVSLHTVLYMNRSINLSRPTSMTFIFTLMDSKAHIYPIIGKRNLEIYIVISHEAAGRIILCLWRMSNVYLSWSDFNGLDSFFYITENCVPKKERPFKKMNSQLFDLQVHIMDV